MKEHLCRPFQGQSTPIKNLAEGNQNLFNQVRASLSSTSSKKGGGAQISSRNGQPFHPDTIASTININNEFNTD
jgi:hypothetical protein